MPKQIMGTVVKKSADKTISVLVNRRVKHPKYQKQLTLSKKFLVHDEKNTANVGDVVTIMQTRPVSKSKHFTLVSDNAADKKGAKE